jgi:hypothetical protein
MSVRRSRQAPRERASSAAESGREGRDETLTVRTLNLSARLRRSLATTNAAESLLSRTRHVQRNVKRWRSGQMMLRWVAAGVSEAVDVRGLPPRRRRVGRGNLSTAEGAEVLEKLPPFDPHTSRSAREHKILVEFLRTYPGSRSTEHPARFVARGRHVDHLFASQPWD